VQGEQGNVCEHIAAQVNSALGSSGVTLLQGAIYCSTTAGTGKWQHLVIKKQQEENHKIHGNSIFAALVAAEGGGPELESAAHPPVMDGYLLRSAGVKTVAKFCCAILTS